MNTSTSIITDATSNYCQNSSWGWLHCKAVMKIKASVCTTLFLCSIRNHELLVRIAEKTYVVISVLDGSDRYKNAGIFSNTQKQKAAKCYAQVQLACDCIVLVGNSSDEASESLLG